MANNHNTSNVKRRITVFIVSPSMPSVKRTETCDPSNRLLHEATRGLQIASCLRQRGDLRQVHKGAGEVARPSFRHPSRPSLIFGSTAEPSALVCRILLAQRTTIPSHSRFACQTQVMDLATRYFSTSPFRSRALPSCASIPQSINRELSFWITPNQC